MNFRIKKLDIFIARQFGLLFAGTFFICQFVLMMQFLWRYIDDLIAVSSELSPKLPNVIRELSKIAKGRA